MSFEAPLNTNTTPSPFPPEQVAEIAKQFWEAEGRPEGRDDEFWFRAEDQLRQQQQDVSAAAQVPPVAPAPVGLS